MPLTKERKDQLKGEFGRGASDSGSPEIQIALLTNRIAQMTEHLKLHSKDYASRRGLLGMVSRRRRLLDYVKRINPEQYLDLLRRLEIRKYAGSMEQGAGSRIDLLHAPCSPLPALVRHSGAKARTRLLSAPIAAHGV